MKASTFCLWGVGCGLFALTVGLFESRPVVAILGAAGAYGAAFGYRQSLRRPKRKKGARK